jgi:hypothetical protein
MSKPKLYEQLIHMNETEQLQWKAYIEQEGYSAFRRLIDEFQYAIKKTTDREEAEVRERIETAARMFPEPAKFSPSWQDIWQELRDMLRWKAQVYRQVPPEEREGEWQILMDNPFTNQEVVCYPWLSFDEAAYLFAYFRPNLERNEYLRLQKVSTAITENGGGAA